MNIKICVFSFLDLIFLQTHQANFVMQSCKIKVLIDRSAADMRENNLKNDKGKKKCRSVRCIEILCTICFGFREKLVPQSYKTFIVQLCSSTISNN